MTSRFILPHNRGQVLGLKFDAGRWYRYSTTVDGWVLCEAVSAARTAADISNLLQSVPFDVALSNEGGDHVH